ncbi:MAG: ArsR/SmtB family transcription factor [Gemmatimonadales bacterium]
MAPDHLSTTLAALADPTRRAILARLTSGEATVTELAAPLPISLPAVSRHLKVLEHAGLITRGHDAQWRPCRLEATPLRNVAEWVEQYRRFWDERLGRLDEYLHGLQTKEPKEKQHGRRKP